MTGELERWIVIVLTGVSATLITLALLTLASLFRGFQTNDNSRLGPGKAGKHRLIWIIAATAGIFVFNPILSGIFFALAFLIPRRRSFLKRRNYEQAISKSVPLAARQLGDELAAGLSIQQAFSQVALRLPAPLADELRQIHRRMDLGESLQSSLESSRQQVGVRTYDEFASAILVNQRLGGNLPATIKSLADGLDADLDANERLQAAISGAQFGMRIVAASPPIVIALMYFIDSKGVVLLLTTFTGQAVLLVVASVYALGLWLGTRIGEQEAS